MRHFGNLTPDMKSNSICVLGGGEAGLSIINELQKKGFKNLTLIDKENFTSTTEDKFLTSRGLIQQKEENNLKKLALNKFGYIFGRVREINYEQKETRKHEIVLTDGQRLSYDSVIMCNGLQKDKKRVENLDKLLKRRDKPVYSMNSYENSLFARRHLTKSKGNVIYTSQGKKSKDVHLNYSAAINHSQNIENTSKGDFSQVKIMNSEKTIYSNDKEFESEIKEKVSKEKIEVQNDRELVKLDDTINIAHFKDSQGNVYQEYYDAIMVDQPVKQDELIQKLVKDYTFDEA